MTPRAVALDSAVAARSAGAALQDELDRRLAASGLERRDRALASEIAMGALRLRLSLDRALSLVSRRPVERAQPALAEALRQAAYQVLFLERVPAHAAVDEAVSLVRERLGRKPAGFANAVLRALAGLVEAKGVSDPGGERASRALHWRGDSFTVLARRVVGPDAPEPERLAALHGYPVWMVERWLARHGRECAVSILRWGNAPPALSVRVNSLKLPRWPLSDDDARRAFEGAGRVEPGAVPGTYRLEAHVPPRELPGLAAGLFTIQDETQARPVRLLMPPAGARVLDLCAGPGGKALALAEMVGPEGAVVAVEMDPAKCELIREGALRMGLGNVGVVTGDAADFARSMQGRFGWVMLDAPCSNLGALDRRPEARTRTSPEALARLAENEARLLESACSALAPGGALVYSVCSFEPEESGDVVRRVVSSGGGTALNAEAAENTENGQGAPVPGSPLSAFSAASASMALPRPAGGTLTGPAVVTEVWTLPEAASFGGGYCARLERSGG
jgi:16S rRNA (cytosine967-C5)-methyltransferase